MVASCLYNRIWCPLLIVQIGLSEIGCLISSHWWNDIMFTLQNDRHILAINSATFRHTQIPGELTYVVSNCDWDKPEQFMNCFGPYISRWFTPNMVAQDCGSPCSSHPNSWCLWMFIPRKHILVLRKTEGPLFGTRFMNLHYHIYLLAVWMGRPPKAPLPVHLYVYRWIYRDFSPHWWCSSCKWINQDGSKAMKL